MLVTPAGLDDSGGSTGKMEYFRTPAGLNCSWRRAGDGRIEEDEGLGENPRMRDVGKQQTPTLTLTYALIP